MNTVLENIGEFLKFTGFANATWGHIAMIIVGLAFIYIAIKREWEPLLLVPIGFADVQSGKHSSVSRTERRHI